MKSATFQLQTDRVGKHSTTDRICIGELQPRRLQPVVVLSELWERFKDTLDEMMEVGAEWQAQLVGATGEAQNAGSQSANR